MTAPSEILLLYDGAQQLVWGDPAYCEACAFLLRRHTTLRSPPERAQNVDNCSRARGKENQNPLFPQHEALHGRRGPAGTLKRPVAGRQGNRGPWPAPPRHSSLAVPVQLRTPRNPTALASRRAFIRSAQLGFSHWKTGLSHLLSPNRCFCSELGSVRSLSPSPSHPRCRSDSTSPARAPPSSPAGTLKRLAGCRPVRTPSACRPGAPPPAHVQAEPAEGPTARSLHSPGFVPADLALPPPPGHAFKASSRGHRPSRKHSCLF